jgi:hypothetical protein
MHPSLAEQRGLRLNYGALVTYFFKFEVWRGVEARQKVGEVYPTIRTLSGGQFNG